MRLVIRIGGSVVASPPNIELLGKYADLVKTVKTQKHEIAVVVGGGALAREFIKYAKGLGLEMQAQDEVAISCSRLFAQLFLKSLGELGCSKVATTLDEASACLQEGKILVMGGLKPGITTDTVAALVAERINADLLVKGTDQEGVYNKDPRTNSNAVKHDYLTFTEFEKIFEGTTHKAGIHQIVDPEAIKVLKRHSVKLIVFNGFKPENLLTAVKGEKIGTVIS